MLLAQKIRPPRPHERHGGTEMTIPRSQRMELRRIPPVVGEERCGFEFVYDDDGVQRRWTDCSLPKGHAGAHMNDDSTSESARHAEPWTHPYRAREQSEASMDEAPTGE